jgi:2-dehydro-3-deoxyglucarate aldolase/4-hydroxy-2-oxoheptanedioate aldolase
MGVAGFDWLVVDLEHGAGDENIMVGQLQAIAVSRTPCLVRVEAIDSPRFAHALDSGAHGVLVPRVASVDDARRSVACCRYAGTRGVARYNRAWHWSLDTRELGEMDAEVVCAIQIETREALEAVDEIAAVDGVDVLFVGPADLAHALGLHCPPDDPRLLAAAEAVSEAARSHDKRAGVQLGTIEQVLAYRRLGFTFLGCNSDSSLLAASATRLASELHNALAERQSG